MNAPADYSVGFTLNDELQIETELRAYVNQSKGKWMPWNDLMPQHRYNNYRTLKSGNGWFLK